MMTRALRSSSRSRAFLPLQLPHVLRLTLPARRPRAALLRQTPQRPFPRRLPLRRQVRTIQSLAPRQLSDLSRRIAGVRLLHDRQLVRRCEPPPRRRRLRIRWGGCRASLALPRREGAPFTFIPSPRAILHLSASPYSNLLLPLVSRVCWQRGDSGRLAPQVPMDAPSHGWSGCLAPKGADEFFGETVKASRGFDPPTFNGAGRWFSSRAQSRLANFKPKRPVGGLERRHTQESSRTGSTCYGSGNGGNHRFDPIQLAPMILETKDSFPIKDEQPRCF